MVWDGARILQIQVKVILVLILQIVVIIKNRFQSRTNIKEQFSYQKDVVTKPSPTAKYALETICPIDNKNNNIEFAKHAIDIFNEFL